jgi:hypothetical protein
MKLEHIVSALRAENIPVERIVRTEFPTVEDDAIHVTEEVHVSVHPDGLYFNVTRIEPGPVFFMYPEPRDLDGLIADIRAAMERAKARRQ